MLGHSCNNKSSGDRGGLTDHVCSESVVECVLLARKANAVGRKVLLELDTVVSPDTLLHWHRQFVGQKWTFTQGRGPGRARIMRAVAELIVRIAQDNPGWGYTAFRERWPISNTALVAGPLPMC